MKLYADSILIGNQWQNNVTLDIDQVGIIQSITQGKSDDATLAQGVVLPGMVNCHSHGFQRAFAGFSEYRANPSDSFWSWRDIMYRFVSKMTPDDVKAVGEFVYLEMLKAGYTSVAEFHYLHHQPNGKRYANSAEMSHQMLAAAESTGIAITLLPVLYTYAGFGEQKPSPAQARFIHQTDEYCQLVEKLFKTTQSQATQQVGIAPHSLRAVSHEQLMQITQHIRQLDSKAPIHIHIAEQMQEVNDSLSYYQQRPVDWLLDHLAVDQSWCLVHATHLSSQEVEKLVQSQAVAGICATTEANLGDGVFPAEAFLQQSGRFAIGSDSHIAVNIAAELRTFEYSQRLTHQRRAVLASDECISIGQNLFAHAAREGASTVNQNVGEIAVGKRADLIVIDPSHPSLFAKKESQILDAAIFACAQLPIKSVMVAGQWQVEQGKHRAEAQIIERYQQVLMRLAN
ncbi:formimidoylglutamate deiminase [Aliikangiella maris]|uniref:Formimidoylglutamate deiminase n=2 Tax=Aliikangiella maris TaxID=3162458 RepID=A0ABV3MIC8_9GAMM